MKRSHFYISILMISILSGCGLAPTPTMSASDLQGTAVAAAWTVVAMTQAAIPTATPNPPTETPSPTPLPTFTLLPPTAGIPTQAFGSPPTNAPIAGGPTSNPCNAPMSPDPDGPKVNTYIQNQSGGSVVLSMQLLEKTPFGECGIYGFNIDPNGGISAQLLEGCYWAGAFVTGKRDSKAFGINLCLKSPSEKIVVTTEEIRLK